MKWTQIPVDEIYIYTHMNINKLNFHSTEHFSHMSQIQKMLSSLLFNQPKSKSIQFTIIKWENSCNRLPSVIVWRATSFPKPSSFLLLPFPGSASCYSASSSHYQSLSVHIRTQTILFFPRVLRFTRCGKPKAPFSRPYSKRESRQRNPPSSTKFPPGEIDSLSKKKM